MYVHGMMCNISPDNSSSVDYSVQFYHRCIGEFWYSLGLVAETPVPTTLAHMECELGRWVRQTITLSNPTDELLNLIPTISNTNNFKLERDSEQPFELQPNSSLSLPVTFMPSTLGPGDHKARIAFHCEQVLYDSDTCMYIQIVIL